MEEEDRARGRPAVQTVQSTPVSIDGPVPQIAFMANMLIIMIPCAQEDYTILWGGTVNAVYITYGNRGFKICTVGLLYCRHPRDHMTCPD